eukprot:scaffold123850_cov56-Attheya_sp.AAC.1
MDNDGTHPPVPPLTTGVTVCLSTPGRAPTIMPRNPYATKHVASTTIHLCETAFSYPACPIVSVHEINKLVVIFYHTLMTIYNWQYCLSVSARTSTISNVTRMHRRKFAETSIVENGTNNA